MSTARKLYKREVWWRQYGIDADGRPMLMLTNRDGDKVHIVGTEQECRRWLNENTQ